LTAMRERPGWPIAAPGVAWVAHRGPWAGCFKIAARRSAGLVGPVMLKSQNQIMAKGYRRAARDEPFLLPPDMRE